MSNEIKIQVSDNLTVILPENGIPYRTDGRDIIKVRYINDEGIVMLQGYYRSTGINTSFQGSWFPFDGIVYQVMGKRGKSVLTQAYPPPLYKDNILYSGGRNRAKELWSGEGELCNSEDNPVGYLWCRLGNCDYVKISYLLGGSLWNSELGDYYKETCGITGPSLNVEIPEGNDNYPVSDETINKFIGNAVSLNVHPINPQHLKYFGEYNLADCFIDRNDGTKIIVDTASFAAHCKQPGILNQAQNIYGNMVIDQLGTRPQEFVLEEEKEIPSPGETVVVPNKPDRKQSSKRKTKHEQQPVRRSARLRK